MLESESNKEDSKSKRSLADVIVEDEDHHKYIIEIERSVKDSFVHKSLFNTSRLIVDNLAQREDYTQIVKVFHISLLYFPIGSGKGAVYHGKTIAHEVDTKEKLCVHIQNQESGEIFDATDILPEYFYISIPLFNDRLEKEIDDWLYVMKYDEIPDNYHSPYMAQVAEKLSILKMTPEERANYSYYQKKLYNDRDELQAAVSRGREEGKAEENIRVKIEIAKTMLYQAYSVSEISAITGLTPEEIAKLSSVSS